MGRRNISRETVWVLDDLGLVRRLERIVVPNDLALRLEIINLYYNNPLARHFGSRKTLKLIR